MRANIGRNNIQYLLGPSDICWWQRHTKLKGTPSMYRRSAISTLSFSHILTLVYVRVAYIQDVTKPG